MPGKQTYYVIEGNEPEQKLTDVLEAKIAEAVKVPLEQLNFKRILEQDRPATNTAMLKLVEPLNVVGITDLTLPIYAAATRAGKFFQLGVEGDVKKVTGLKVEVELEKPKSGPASADN